MDGLRFRCRVYTPSRTGVRVREPRCCRAFLRSQLPDDGRRQLDGARAGKQLRPDFIYISISTDWPCVVSYQVFVRV